MKLTDKQQADLKKYCQLLCDCTQKVNLISKGSVDEAWMRHIEHSLVLTKRSFPAGADVVDLGTGGGLPGIVLAICFPEVNFHLVDSTAKKIKMVQSMTDSLGLTNARSYNVRAENWEGTAHYAVSRATAPLDKLWRWFEPIRVPLEVGENDWPAGLICLKGGNLQEEKKRLLRRRKDLSIHSEDLSLSLTNPYFEEKVLLVVT